MILVGEESGVDIAGEDDNNDLQNQVQVNQDLIEKDETVWQSLAASHVQRGRSQQQSILSFKRGPTAFVTNRIINCSPLRFFCVLFDGTMLRNMRKCTIGEAHCISDIVNWDMTLDELEKFIGVDVVRGILGQRHLSEESLWEST